MSEPAPGPARRAAAPEPGPGLSRLCEEFAAATGVPFRLELYVDEACRTVLDVLPDDADTGPPSVCDLDDGMRIECHFGPRANADDVFPRLLVALAGPIARIDQEVGFYRTELARRYGELDLLTSVAEILSAGLALERSVQGLLGSLAEVMGAAGADLWMPDDSGARLELLASAPETAGHSLSGIDLELNRGPVREAFRTGNLAWSRDGEYEELVAPVQPTAARGLVGALGALGVRRARGKGFTPADRQLVRAIAGQIGAAFENRRLSEDSLERERMLVELELAHDLQLRLLPEVRDFADCADIAARCEPAEGVGGDFYHLFRLTDDRIGVMLGDVSSHGYSAGLIMALTMSAASLVVRDGGHPGSVLQGIHHELVRKLESTDMYMTLCYAVVDPRSGTLRYANAGHPHAFLIGADAALRLEALNPPLGIAEFDHYEEREVDWHGGDDTLLMFTDGLSETMRADRLWSDDLIIDAIREHRGEPACDIIERLFEIASATGALAADDRTALVLK